MLTIGQLAAYVGVTVRAVRHYHQRGLLAEPDRDASGYRRYDAQAVIDLIRIKTLSDAGVPLARIEELLGAGTAEFSAALVEIDEALTRRIRELEGHRVRIGELVGGERLFLPTEVVDFLDQLRGLGVSDRAVRLERDGWVLITAQAPERVAEWIAQKRTLLADGEFRYFYVMYDQAYSWDPDDPRLEELADAAVDFVSRQHQRPDDAGPDWPVRRAMISALVASHIASTSPSWERLTELTDRRLEALGLSSVTSTDPPVT